MFPRLAGAIVDGMDITQLLITIGAIIGIVIVGALAVIPTVTETSARRQAHSTPHKRDDVDLAA